MVPYVVVYVKQHYIHSNWPNVGRGLHTGLSKRSAVLYSCTFYQGASDHLDRDMPLRLLCEAFLVWRADVHSLWQSSHCVCVKDESLVDFSAILPTTSPYDSSLQWFPADWLLAAISWGSGSQLSCIHYLGNAAALRQSRTTQCLLLNPLTCYRTHVKPYSTAIHVVYVVQNVIY